MARPGMISDEVFAPVFGRTGASVVVGVSYQVFTAGPEPSGPWPGGLVAGSVSRLSVTPPTLSVVAALPVVMPVVELVKTMVHWPSASVTPASSASGGRR